MPPKRDLRQINYGTEARTKLLTGAKKIYEAVSSTYGPDGNNVLLDLPFGDPTLTRDGVTVARRVSAPNIGLPDRIENMAAAIMRQASEKTNKTAGDGTTATIVLGYNLLTVAHKRVVAGEKSRVIKKQLDADVQTITDFLTAQSVDAKDHLHEVATVSAGDPAVGSLVADTMIDVGVSGGVTIREQTYPGIDVEKVNGYYFDKGFFALSQPIQYAKPHIFISNKPFTSNADIVPLLNAVIQDPNQNKKLVFIGDLSGDALNTYLANVIQGKFEGVVIPPPAYGNDAMPFLEDISIYTGAKVFTQADAPKDINASYFGTADTVQVSQDHATIFGGGGDADAIIDRAASIQELIDSATEEHKKDKLEQRYSKLVGKIAIINVGGSTQAEMEELKYRVEDAVEATKSAMADGVLPGGATMLVHIALNLDISDIFKEALELTFKKLMDNAAEDPGYRLKQVQKAKFGHGFNLRAMTEEPIDLAKAGIWDATRAVVQTIENATSASGAILTTNATVTVIEQEAQDAPTEAN